MSDAWVGIVEHIKRGLIQKPDARMGEGDTIILRNPRLQVYVLIFVENGFLWFLYFQVEFTIIQRRVGFQGEVLLAEARRLLEGFL